jgi:hypothetical protein
VRAAGRSQPLCCGCDRVGISKQDSGLIRHSSPRHDCRNLDFLHSFPKHLMQYPDHHTKGSVEERNDIQAQRAQLSYTWRLLWRCCCESTAFRMCAMPRRTTIRTAVALQGTHTSHRRPFPEDHLSAFPSSPNFHLVSTHKTTPSPPPAPLDTFNYGWSLHYSMITLLLMQLAAKR